MDPMWQSRLGSFERNPWSFECLLISVERICTRRALMCLIVRGNTFQKFRKMAPKNSKSLGSKQWNRTRVQPGDAAFKVVLDCHEGEPFGMVLAGAEGMKLGFV